jgi:opacity protein-like surface antigen
MKTLRTLFAVPAIALLAPVAVEAQIPLSIEASVGAVVPTGDFAEGLTTGFGFGVNAAYRVMPMLDVYAGYSWQRFGIEDDPELEGIDMDIDDTGFAFGARVNMPMPGINPWVRAGLIMHQMKFSASAEGMSFSDETDLAAGFEAAAGVAIALAPRISLTPSLSYRSYKPKYDGETADEAVSYFGVNIGARFSF